MSSSQAESQSICPASGPPRIRQLPESVVNKIAAGEVIQRPFNAVKELIENSLDAGSTLIQIILREGGLKLIQVQDNGHGIQPDDLPILCERFTTSKLKRFEDLSHLATFGFRGEALASLSYVSRLTVTTRPADQPFAFKMDYREGKPLASARPCAGNPGTNITAEDLFFNVPVRREALRSPREEFSRVSEVVSKYSLHFSGKCGFFLRSLDKRSGTAGPVGSSGDFRTAADWSRQDVVRALFGQRTADDLIPVSSCQSFEAEPTRLAIQQLGLRFDALLTNPNKITSAGLPSVQLVLFVNDRLIECSVIKHAIEAAYAAILPQHVDSLYASARVEPSGTRSSTNFSVLNLRASSLFVYLGLQLPPDTLDVNVHPTKAEVHFLHEDAVVAGLREAFIKSLLVSSGSKNVLMRSLRLSPDKPSPKISCLDVLSKPSIRASPTPAASRPQDMVRTDVRTQRLEAFLHGGPLQAPVSFVDLTPKRSPSPDIESDSEEPPSSRFGVY
uniref:DNA mismatch repair protein Mlh1 n=1 Tax=Schistocephalus solidus TaxID=70667 RepID=A0A0X3NRR8_SCHSO